VLVAGVVIVVTALIVEMVVMLKEILGVAAAASALPLRRRASIIGLLYIELLMVSTSPSGK
jgi:hypothetical protein